MSKHYLMGIVMFIIANLSIPQPIYAQCDNNFLDSCIRTAIKDFAKGKRFDDKVYSVDVYLEDSEVIGISIFGQENKYYASPVNKVGSLPGSFPTGYMEIDNKLFCWQVPDKPITSEIIAILSKYDHIDSTYADSFNGIIPEYIVDDKKKAMHYYFCKNNIRKFKKVKTSIGIGYYKRPKLECN